MTNADALKYLTMPNPRITALLIVFGCSLLLSPSPTFSQNSSGSRPPIPGNPKPNSNAQTQSSPLRFLIRQGNRLGYIDQTGKVVIPPQFAGHESGAFSLHDAIAYEFHDGLAPARVGKQWGYINVNGQFVIPPQFDEARAFREGRAAVKIGQKWGFIDTTGKRVTPLQFDSVQDFSDGLAQVYNFGVDTYRYVDGTGKIALKPPFRELNGSSFFNGFAIVLISGNPQKWDFMDKTGKLLGLSGMIPAGNFSEGLAPVTINWEKIGFIDRTGKVLIAPQFAQVEGGFSDGLVAVAMGNKWGYIDKIGKWVIAPQFDDARPFVEGLAAVEFRRGNAYPSLWGYIDKTGELVIKPQFEEAANFQNGLAAVRRENDSDWSYIDKTGKLIWQSQSISN